MIFRVKSRAAVKLEPIAFADISINLFVFFFLAFGVLAQFNGASPSRLPIDLPQGGSRAPQTADDILIVTMDRDSKLFVDSELASEGDLEKRVNEALTHRNVKALRVQPDKTLTLDEFIPVLDRLRQTNARSISIDTKQ